MDPISGETEERPSGWTTDTLLAHLDRILREVDRRYQDRYDGTLGNVRDLMALQRSALEALVGAERDTRQAAMSAQEKAVAAALASQQRAVELAEVMAQRWREQANEWRSAMSDRERHFATMATTSALEKRLDSLEKGRDEGQGAWKYLTAFVGLAVGLIVIVSTVIIIASR